MGPRPSLASSLPTVPPPQATASGRSPRALQPPPWAELGARIEVGERLTLPKCSPCAWWSCQSRTGTTDAQRQRGRCAQPSSHPGSCRVRGLQQSPGRDTEGGLGLGLQGAEELWQKGLNPGRWPETGLFMGPFTSPGSKLPTGAPLTNQNTQIVKNFKTGTEP